MGPIFDIMLTFWFYISNLVDSSTTVGSSGEGPESANFETSRAIGRAESVYSLRLLSQFSVQLCLNRKITVCS